MNTTPELAALSAVHEIETLTRLWVENSEEDRAAAIILKHFAPLLAAHHDEKVAVNAALNKTDARGMSEIEQIEWLAEELATLRAQLDAAQARSAALKRWSVRPRKAKSPRALIRPTK